MSVGDSEAVVDGWEEEERDVLGRALENVIMRKRRMRRRAERWTGRYCDCCMIDVLRVSLLLVDFRRLFANRSDLRVPRSCENSVSVAVVLSVCSLALKDVRRSEFIDWRELMKRNSLEMPDRPP